ncbi:Piezo-type mechanosensitive ion channel component [Aphelenchoides bicaudatus]|nr:Piezo-type mechanosensitive ion channel component [Aphelenchoides bicaudatus]
MVSALLKTIFYRVLLPISLLVAGLLRPSFISLLYVFLALLASIFPPIPKSARLAGSTKTYLIVTFLATLLAILAQLIYQITDHFVDKDERTYKANCDHFQIEYWLIQFGLIRLPIMANDVEWNFVRIIAPEIIATSASLLTLIVCSTNGVPESSSSSTHNLTENEQVPEVVVSNSSQPESNFCSSFTEAAKRVSDLLTVFFIIFVGIINASVLNLMYFICGMSVLTWWSLYSPLKRHSFNQIKLSLIVYAGLHFLLLFLYQIPVTQYYLDSDSFVARLVGLTPLVESSCKHYWAIKFTDATWTQFTNFFLVVIFYHLAILQYNWTRYGIRQAQPDNDSSVHEEGAHKRETMEMHSILADQPQNHAATAQNEEASNNTLLSPDQEEAHDSLPLQRLTSQVIDRQKISFIFRGSSSQHSSWFTDIAQQFCYFTLYHSYVFALVAMLVWAMFYHSVFGLIFLITPCIILALYESRKVSFKASPILVIYAEFLLLAQYVYSMNLKIDELPNENYMKIIGFVRAETRTAAFTTLAIKITLSLPLFALLRLHLREDYYDNLSGHDIRRSLNYGTFGNPRNSHPVPIPHPFSLARKNFINYVSRALSGAWIFVVVIVLLFNSITEPPVLYGLGYFVLWTAIILNLVISFPVFRRSIFVILTILIVYSSVVLVALYCYQFPSVPDYWKRLTHLSDAWNLDIGLVNFKNDGLESSLFARLSKPILLLIVTMVQLKFFHRSWSQLVETPSMHSRSSSVTRHEGKPVDVTISKLRVLSKATYEVLWRLAEIHLHRFVLFVIMLLVTSHYCALNFVAVFLVVIALCIPSFNRLILLITCGYLSMVFVARRVFVMHFIQRFLPIGPTDCNSTDLGINTTETIVEWIGFRENETLSGDLIGIIITLSLIGIQFAIQYRQKHRRRRYGIQEPPEGVIFTEAIDFSRFDASLLMGFKVFCNYTFYKFGLELSMICMVYVAWVRMDFVASILLCWVLVFSLSRRSICRIIWPFFVIYLAIELPLQYAMVLGLPSCLCIQYPWANLLNDTQKDDNFLSFLDLANYRANKDHFSNLIIADFLLLMVAAAQWLVFKVESKNHPAGSNNSIYSNGDFTLRKENPHFDYIAEQKSFVDYIKIVLFHYGHWVTLIMVLTAGLGGTSLFALGYLVLAFWMLWQGTNLYTMRNYKRTLSRWYILCAYNVMAMLWKVSLQIIGCVFARDMDSWDSGLGCIIRQLFSIVCVDEASVSRLYGGKPDKCSVEIIETKIGLDLLAFAMIVFQLRVLHSYLFQYCVIDIRCEIIQASRGAILINQLIEKQMNEQNDQQQKLFKEIKKRMVDIRKNYEDQQRKSEISYFVPETYAQGKFNLKSQICSCRNSFCESYDVPYTSFVNDPRRFSYIDEDDPFPYYDPQRYERLNGLHSIYHHAKRSGDYFMFEYDPRNEEDISHPEEQYVTEVSPGAGDFDKLDPTQLIHTAITRDMDLKGTLTSVESAEKIKDEEKRMIEAPKKRTLDPDEAARQVLKKHKLDDDDSSSEDEIAVIEQEQPDSDKSKSEQDEENQTFAECAFSYMRFGWKMCTSALHYLSAFFDRHSREHRYVAFVLDQEKKNLKYSMCETLYAVDRSTESLRSEWKKRGKYMVSSAKDITTMEQAAKVRWEQLTFFATFAHVLLIRPCGGLLTLPLPLMVFFWGTLCNPRPPKLFWIFMITYTEMIIVIKFIFQFGFYPWNRTDAIVKDSPQVFKGQYLLGIQKVDYFAVYDVILLIALFLHRYMLRRIGLWKDSTSTDTFIVETKASDSKRPSVNNGAEGENPNFALEQQEPGTSKQLETEFVQDEEEEKKLTGFNFFCYSLLHPKFRYIRDLYPIMFFLDVFCMLILVVKYNQFGELSSNSSVLLSNRIPILFVVLIFVFLIMIVIDRALYLRKAVAWKLVYQLFTIALLHIWIFWTLPGITKTEAADNRAAAWLYVVKCLYLIVSSWQIRNGYPKFSTGNLLTHSYGLVNYVLFYVFMFLPLVFELRTIIDWTWTGQPRGKLIKLMYGLPAILAVIFLLGLEGYPPLYAMSAQGLDLETADKADVRNLTKWFSSPSGNRKSDQDHARMAISFINDYTTSGTPDLMKIRFRPESDVFWSISSESLDAMQQELRKSSEQNVTLMLRIHLEFVRGRSDDTKEPLVHSADYFINVEPRSSLSRNLQNAIKSPGHVVSIENALPYYLLVPNEGKVQDADILLQTLFPSTEKAIEKCGQCSLNATKNLKNTRLTTRKSTTAEKTERADIFKCLPLLTDFFPSIIAKYTQGGIVAAYLAIVYFAARIIRSVVTSEPLDVIIQEMPNPDYLLKICLDIYLVREARDFILEEDLFAKLIFLFRSPATLIKWTRYKVKQN